MTDFEPTELVEIIGSNGADTPLITILEQIQARHHYLPREAIILVSDRLGLPLSQVYSVATFYNAFNLERRGRHGICACVGTACHVRGAQQILNRLEEKLGIQPGETTPDWKYSLDTVHCLGACALGPILVVDDEYWGQMHPKKVDEVLERIEEADKAEDRP